MKDLGMLCTGIVIFFLGIMLGVQSGVFAINDCVVVTGSNEVVIFSHENVITATNPLAEGADEYENMNADVTVEVLLCVDVVSGKKIPNVQVNHLKL